MTFVAATELANGATVEADLCILGAGAAGIAIAREFAGSGARVTMLANGRLLRDFGRVARRPGEAARSMAERVVGVLTGRRALAARFTLEPLPMPDSRVTLDPRRADRFGMPRVRVDWRLADRDRLGPERLRATLGAAFAEAAIGRLDLHAELSADGHPVGLEGGKHHIGTTRMHADPRQGVVDADCRLHGIESLYVAGSSIFPTAGYVNPTLTIVALALRPHRSPEDARPQRLSRGRAGTALCLRVAGRDCLFDPTVCASWRMRISTGTGPSGSPASG